MDGSELNSLGWIINLGVLVGGIEGWAGLMLVGGVVFSSGVCLWV